MQVGEYLGGEFASEGSGVLASEEHHSASGCTCDQTRQPDQVKVGTMESLKRRIT